MAENQIAKMRISHEMILDWLILNPERTQGDCAREFGVTEPWLSVVVNSDCFQARWKQRRMMLDKKVTDLTTGKMQGVVQAGLERLELLVEASADPRFVLDTTDKILGRLGYGPKSSSGVVMNTQVNNYSVSKDVLDRARGVIREQGHEALATEGGRQMLPEVIDASPQGPTRLEVGASAPMPEGLTRLEVPSPAVPSTALPSITIKL